MKDIPVVTEILQNVTHVYSVIFGEMPQFEKTEKSATEKAISALRFYAKIRNFVIFIVDNK